MKSISVTPALSSETYKARHSVTTFGSLGTRSRRWLKKELSIEELFETIARGHILEKLRAASERRLLPDKRRDKVGPPSSCCMHDVATDTYRHYRLRAEAAQVGNAGTEEDGEMKCSIEGCRGEYEAAKSHAYGTAPRRGDRL